MRVLLFLLNLWLKATSLDIEGHFKVKREKEFGDHALILIALVTNSVGAD